MCQPHGVWHVTASANRASISEHGLDWRRMRVARGIAGSMAPEQEGCFLCQDEGEVDWFIRMNTTGGPVDVWQVTGVDPAELVESPEGHLYVPRVIRPDQLRLVRTDVTTASRSDQ